MSNFKILFPINTFLYLFEDSKRIFGIYHRIWDYFLVYLVQFSVKWLKVFCVWEIKSELQVIFFVTFYFLWFWSDYLSSRHMLFSDKRDFNQVSWNYVVRNRCQHNLQILKKLFYFHILSAYLFRFLQDAISAVIFYIHMCYQLVLIKEFFP